MHAVRTTSARQLPESRPLAWALGYSRTPPKPLMGWCSQFSQFGVLGANPSSLSSCCCHHHVCEEAVQRKTPQVGRWYRYRNNVQRSIVQHPGPWRGPHHSGRQSVRSFWAWNYDADSCSAVTHHKRESAAMPKSRRLYSTIAWEPFALWVPMRS